MHEKDLIEFSKLLDETCATLSLGKYRPSPNSAALFFRALAQHPLDVVRAAFAAHIADTTRGQYVPKPADILAQIEGLAAVDGRPGAEEAWALAIRASDESETIVWTEEMAQAWLVCQPVMNMGDEVGARMAFKESYSRQVEDARRMRRPVAWSASLGHDASKRLNALSRAETMGLLGVGEALRIAPPEQASNEAFTLLLETSVKRSDQAITDPAVIKARAAELKAKLIKTGSDPEIAARQRAAVNEQKAEMQRIAEQHSDEPLQFMSAADFLSGMDEYHANKARNESAS